MKPRVTDVRTLLAAGGTTLVGLLITVALNWSHGITADVAEAKTKVAVAATREEHMEGDIAEIRAAVLRIEEKVDRLGAPR